MQGENKNNEMFKDMYKSAIRASYFMGIQDPNFVRKSRMQVEDIGKNQDKEVDEKTFRMMKGFKRPEDNFKIYSKKSTVYFDAPGGFLCFSSPKKKCTAEIYNTKFSIKNGDQIVNFVDFNAVSASVLEDKNKLYIAFEGLPKDKSISFEIRDDGLDDHKSWANMLHKIIHESDGAQKHYTYLATTCPNFQKSEQILNSEFEARANTGDILLFRSPHSAARAQRLITNSQYDHVGVVLRNKKNELFVFESTTEDGVGMTPWKHMIKYEWYTSCQKICWRPLNMQLADIQVQIIEAYVAKTLGKQFELNLNKLLMFTSKLERTKQDQEKKTYFCSELVARLYKELKLIDGEKSSTSYYPVDFSSKGNLKIAKNGVSLGNQKIIAFEKVK